MANARKHRRSQKARGSEQRPELMLVQTHEYGTQAVLEIPVAALRPISVDSNVPSRDAVLVFVPKERLLEWAGRLADLVV